MAKDFRSFLAEYEELHPDLVSHVWEELPARWKPSAIAIKAQKELKDPPLFVFHNVRTESGQTAPFPVVANMFASRRRCAFAVDSTFERIGRDLFGKRSERIKPVVVDRSDAPVKQVVQTGQEVDLFTLPALVHAAWDPGAYISAGYLTTYDPDTGTDNTALQRGWIYGSREVRCSVSSASHNRWNIRKLEGQGKDARVAYWVGHHPAVCIGAEARLGYPESHWEAVGGVIGEPLRLVPSETLGDDFLVPADAEFVIEGIMPRGGRKPEGPFGEYTRYFGGQRLNPYFEVTAVTHRHDPYWFTIVTGYADDGIGGFRREGNVYDLVKRVVPQVTNVHRPSAAPSHMYIQLRKTQDWQGRAIIMAALSSPDDVKHVFVFDDDVDIFDEVEVQWAISTRGDWAKDLIVVPNLHASGLDPSASGPMMGTRAGLDCTKPAPPGTYEQRSFIPQEVMDEVRLEHYLPGVQQRPAS